MEKEIKNKIITTVLTKIVKKETDTVVIKKHLYSLDNETIKAALIANGMYDSDMRLTASYR